MPHARSFWAGYKEGRDCSWPAGDPDYEPTQDLYFVWIRLTSQKRPSKTSSDYAAFIRGYAGALHVRLAPPLLKPIRLTEVLLAEKLRRQTPKPSTK